MAKAAKCTIAEVEEIVPVGSLDPDQIHLPGVYVHRLIKGEKYEKRIEKLTVSSDTNEIENADSPAAKRREKIVRRAAKEFKVNNNGPFLLGILRLVCHTISFNGNNDRL
jgi:3-oxoacid CoA-transferase